MRMDLLLSRRDVRNVLVQRSPSLRMLQLSYVYFAGPKTRWDTQLSLGSWSCKAA